MKYGVFPRKPAFEAGNYAAGVLAFIQENFADGHGSIEVREYFRERAEKAAKQLEKARSLQFKIWKSRRLFQNAVWQQPAGIKARKL